MNIACMRPELSSVLLKGWEKLPGGVESGSVSKQKMLSGSRHAENGRYGFRIVAEEHGPSMEEQADRLEALPVW